MSRAHDALLRRADRFIHDSENSRARVGIKSPEPWGLESLVRALRDALVAADALPDAVRLDKMRLAKLDEIIDDLTEMRAFLAAHKPLETTLTATASRVQGDGGTTSLADRGSNESALRAMRLTRRDVAEALWLGEGGAWDEKRYFAFADAFLALLSERDEAAP